MASQIETPPTLQSSLPTAKEKKYDRQLRLWAASGQEALENANLLLLNANPGAVGVEILKNLILPGIGSFTIVDEESVTEKDLGVNFFLTEESLGKSRASETCKYLSELNSDVASHGIQKSISEFVQGNDWRSSYTLIFLVGPSESTEEICKDAAKRSIPLFYIHSTGFYSHFSIQLPELFPIVDTHPDPASTQDLRLLDPWPALTTLQEEMAQDIDTLDDHRHGHVPYLILLLHYLGEWKSTHGGQPPQNYKEKKEFKALVESGARTSSAEGVEENYAEAASAVLKSLNPTSTPSGLKQIFEESACDFQSLSTPNFWPIAAGIREFHKKHNGLLPIPGSIPDMKAQSADYIRLQNAYKQKARDDLAEVSTLIRKSRPPASKPVPDSEIEAFCKNAAHVKLIRGKPLHILSNEHPTIKTSTQQQTKLRNALLNPSSLSAIYLAFQIEDYFSSLKSTVSLDDKITFANTQIDEVLGLSKTAATNITTEKCTTSQDEAQSKGPEVEAEDEDEEEDDSINDIRTQLTNILTELDRANGAELHNIAALTGGMVAQEAIKVITKQYVPVDNICVFDGIGSRTGVFNI